MGAIATAKEWAKSFYQSKAWRETRAAYIESVGGLCERCLAEGRYVPGKVVHHKVWLTPANINDPSVSLNWDNLELLCQEHHNIEHHRTNQVTRVGLSFDPDGNIVVDR